MSSPLLPYENARLLIQAPGTVEMSSGRITPQAGVNYLFKCFLKRADSTGTESGAQKLPSQPGNVLPGASGQVSLYRGYAIQYAIIAGSFSLGAEDNDDFSWIEIKKRPPWLFTGMSGFLQVGTNSVVSAIIQQASGKFGGMGIDELVYREIGGVPVIISGGELQG
jgi:hypothetical protein